MHKQHRGFTVIELLIVLALAGLVVLIVFLAVPAAQRTARNNVRQKDAGLVLAAVIDFKTASQNGSLPDSCDASQPSCFLKGVARGYYTAETEVNFVKLDHQYADADARLHADDQDATEKLIIYSYATCNEARTAPTGQYASPQSVAVHYAIETFSGPALQCKQI